MYMFKVLVLGKRSAGRHLDTIRVSKELSIVKMNVPSHTLVISFHTQVTTFHTLAYTKISPNLHPKPSNPTTNHAPHHPLSPPPPPPLHPRNTLTLHLQRCLPLPPSAPPQPPLLSDTPTPLTVPHLSPRRHNPPPPPDPLLHRLHPHLALHSPHRCPLPQQLENRMDIPRSRRSGPRPRRMGGVF